MAALGIILLCFGFVCFCLAAALKTVDKVQLIAIGLAFVTAATIFGGVTHILAPH